MQWQHTFIPLDQLPATFNKLLIAIKNGDNKVDKIRCVYYPEDSNIPIMLTPYDFVDLNPKPKVQKFYLYQLFNES